MPAEKRQAVRRTTSIQGWVKVMNCGIESLIPCKIVDASSTGARLIFRATRDVPDKFGLRLSPTAQTAKECRVVWRFRDDIGVLFT
jgi:hypothetical protein